MVKLSRIYGLVVLSFGIVLLVAAFGWSTLRTSSLLPADIIPIAFIVGCVLVVPAILTYTKCGLNTDSSEKMDPEPYRRHRELRKLCPAWPYVWYGIIVMIGGSMFLAVSVPNSVNPFFAFGGGFCVFAGIWTLYVYPIAKAAFLSGES